MCKQRAGPLLSLIYDLEGLGGAGGGWEVGGVRCKKGTELLVQANELEKSSGRSYRYGIRLPYCAIMENF